MKYLESLILVPSSVTSIIPISMMGKGVSPYYSLNINPTLASSFIENIPSTKASYSKALKQPVKRFANLSYLSEFIMSNFFRFTSYGG